VGKELGKGRRLSEILEEMNMVAEGVYTTRAAQALSEKHGVKMPIVNEVYKILFEDKQPNLAVNDLMSRKLTNETI
jgi:glycerol-3-phosphate dehydrogenase (NAD(P)+)